MSKAKIKRPVPQPILLIPTTLITQEKMVSIAQDITHRMVEINIAFTELANTINRIDECAQLAVKLPFETFKARLKLHSGKLSKDGQDFKNVLNDDPVSRRVYADYINYITLMVSAYQDGIEDVVKGKDNGKHLREITGDFDLNQTFCDSVNAGKAGIGRHADPETDYLYDMAEILVYGKQRLTWGKAAEKLIEILSAQEPYLTEVQKNVLSRLKFSSDAGDLFKQAHWRRKAARA